MTRSRFTPSLMPHELLERLFVAREPILNRVMERVQAATTSDERNHTLLVGPRGSGKTHLVSLVYYRARDRGAQLAWLPEDPWTIVSYGRLLREIATRLEPPFDEPVPSETEELERWLIHRAHSEGPIVVLVENLDQILSALANEGQQRLRHLLQAHRPFLLVATSTRLDRSLSDQAKPFYGFFTTTRLEPFDHKQAAAMLSAIAGESGDQRLVDYLGSDEGKRRLQTIAHLAGGQPRIWALLASALDVEKLSELVELLLTRFDDLTPYYQEQLARLSPQQRLLVAELAEADRPINVSQLATRLDIDQRSLSKTVSELVERGWLVPTTSHLTTQLDRRRTYYELGEPLARLAFQIKDARGEPLRLVVEFLKHWYDPGQLAMPFEGVVPEYLALAAAGQDSDPVVAATRHLSRLPKTRAPAVGLLGEIDDALVALDADNPEPLLCLPTSVRTVLENQIRAESSRALRNRVHRAALGEFGVVRHPDMDAWIQRAEQLVATDPEDPASQITLTNWLARAWRFDEAEEALRTTRDLLGLDDVRALRSASGLATAYYAAGRLKEAISGHEESLARLRRMVGNDALDTLGSTANLAIAYQSAGRLEDALPLYETALEGFERTLGHDHQNTLIARSILAGAYKHDGRVADAVALYEEIVSALTRSAGPQHWSTLAAQDNLGSGYRSAGRVRDAIDLLERTLVDQELAGGDDLESSLTRGNLALAYSDVGRFPEAISLLEQVMTEHIRVLGTEHPTTMITRENLAFVHSETGHVSEAITLYEQVLEQREHVFGTEHPFTIRSRQALARARDAGRPSPPTDPGPALDPR